jgi:hypothetical protein
MDPAEIRLILKREARNVVDSETVEELEEKV